MSDISIGKSSRKNGVENSSQVRGEYAKLKKEYKLFKKNAAKSDLANSPTLKEKELELLSALKEAAEKEGKSDELTALESQISALKSDAKPSVEPVSGAYYNPVSFKGSIKVSEYSKKLEDYADSKGYIDENTQRIINAFVKQGDENSYQISYLIKKCRNDEDEQITPDKLEAVELLANAGVSPMFVSLLLEEFSKTDEKFNDYIDMSLCSKIADFKAMGFEDFDSLVFTRLLKENFSDENVVKSSIKSMANSDISPNTIAAVIRALSVKDVQTGEKRVSPSAVKSVITLKKALSLHRNNEKAERDNPINLLNVIMFKMGDNTVLVMKGNDVTYITPMEGETVHDLKKEYDDVISKIEDNMLVEFASRYKDENGEIDSKALRTMAALRSSGICYDQLFPMTDLCYQDGDIDKDKLSTIGVLKSAGALGVDIPRIMGTFEKSSDGKYSPEDVKNACDLTSSVIGGKEVAALLPEVRGRENVKEFFVDFSRFFETKSHLLELIPLIKNEKAEIDKNAMDVLYNLADNFFSSSDSTMNEEDFMKNAADIIYSAMNDDEVSVNDEGAGICSIMCQNHETPENILEGLRICKTKNGKIDEQLADILWDMSVQHASLDEIKSVLAVCKNDNDVIIHNMSEYIIALFESGSDKEKVLQLVRKLNEE